MMNNWLICTVRYDALDEYGQVKAVTEQILVNAISFTEAERKIIAYKSKSIKGELFINKITKDNPEDIIDKKGDYWFKAKVVIVDINDSGKEKKYTKSFYISGCNFENATEELRIFLNKSFLVDTHINSLSLTKITDLIM